LWEPLTFTKKSIEEPDVIKITATVHKKGKIGLIGDRRVLKK
jgi:methionine aminopeptidase